MRPRLQVQLAAVAAVLGLVVQTLTQAEQVEMAIFLEMQAVAAHLV
jgi:hypothetical protein